MEEITDPFTPEERERLKRRGGRIALGVILGFFILSGGCVATLVAAAPDGAEHERYEACAAEVDRQTPAALWKHSDSVPGYVNDAADRTRLSIIGSCMEELEKSGH